MRIGNRRTWAILGPTLLVLAGYGAYQAVLHSQAAHHYRAAQESLGRRDFQQASLHLRNCLEAQPGDLTARLLAAQTARRQGDYSEAERHLRIFKQQRGAQTALELETKLLDLQSSSLELAEELLAHCAANLEAPETPLILEAIVESSFEHMQPFSSGKVPPIGTDAPHLARVKQALELWGQLRHNEAEDVQGLIWQGRFHERSNEHTKAVAGFRQALKLDPNHYQTQYYLALAVVQENPPLAATFLEALRQRDPENFMVRFTLATIRHSLGQFKEAREILDEILNSSPAEKSRTSSTAKREGVKKPANWASIEVSSLLERGLVELDDNNLVDAERWLLQALAQAPAAPEIHIALSRCLRLAGRTAEANRHQAEFDRLDALQRRP